MAYADIGEVRLFFTDEDEGDPPILMVHGFSCDGHDWMWQIPHFAESHRVIVVDLRGHGRSSVPADGYEPKQVRGRYRRAARATRCRSGGSHGPLARRRHGECLGGRTSGAGLGGGERRSRVPAPGRGPPHRRGHGRSARHHGSCRRRAAVPVGELLSRDAAGVEVVPHAPHRGRARPRPRGDARWALRRRGLARLPRHVGAVPPAAACPVLAFYTDPDRAAFEATLFDDPRSESIACVGSGHWLHQERPVEFNTVVDGWLASL